MKMTLLAKEDQLLDVQLEGPVTPTGMLVEDDPLAIEYGEDVYGKRVLLGMEHVNFLNSGGLNWLLNAQKRFSERGGRLVLYAAPAQVSQVLQLLSVDRVLDVAETRARAKSLAEDGQ
jgi:hypothetical protein